MSLRKLPAKVLTAIPLIFIAIGLFLLYANSINQTNQTELNRNVGKTNQFYNRVVACLASETPIKRTLEYTKYCYDLVEKQTGVKPERYGSEKQ